MSRPGGDERLMDLALETAASAAHATSPNPMVGAVVADEGGTVAVGVHQQPGGPHAEIAAVRAAGERARGADLLVTLEPCPHHGRTPPCVDALIAAGLRRCVIAMIDPNPKVSGRGVAALRAAGIEVTVGIREREARRLNELYVKHATTGLPFVTAKFAMSLDGRIATRSGRSRWITSHAARRHAHELRRSHDAVLVGADTVLRDDPSLTTRLPEGGRSPLRVVVDSTLRLDPGRRVFGPQPGGVLVATTERSDPGRRAALEARGIAVEVLPADGGRVRLDSLLCLLGRRGVLGLLVEGGSSVHGSAFDARLVDRVVACVSPRVIGGRDAPAAVGGRGVEELWQAAWLAELTVSRLGPDLLVTGYCCR